ncbi:MAG: hypothetical protein HPY71_14385 [Firmicutes bacterium]|nr:hypothetical protein [Bacillota bacterium]
MQNEWASLARWALRWLIGIKLFDVIVATVCMVYLFALGRCLLNEIGIVFRLW